MVSGGGGEIELAPIAEQVSGMRRKVAAGGGGQDRISNLLQLAQTLLYQAPEPAGQLSTKQTEKKSSYVQSGDPEVLLLALLALKELEEPQPQSESKKEEGGGDAARKEQQEKKEKARIKEATRAMLLAGNVLIRHRKLLTFIEVGTRASLEVAASAGVQQGAGLAALVAGDFSRGHHLLSGVAARNHKDVPTLLMLAKSVVCGRAWVPASAAAQAVHHMHAALAALPPLPSPPRNGSGQPDDVAPEDKVAVSLASSSSANLSNNCPEDFSYLRGRVLHVLGSALACGARAAPCMRSRTHLQTQALQHLQLAGALEPKDPSIQYELALQLAEMGQRSDARCHLAGALQDGHSTCAATWRLAAELAGNETAGGSAWPADRLEAGLQVLDAGLEQIPKGLSQVPLLQTIAVVHRAGEDHQAAIAAMKDSLSLLAMYKAARNSSILKNSSGPLPTPPSPSPSLLPTTLQAQALEAQVRGDLAELYAELEMSDDVEVCCNKISALLGPHCAEVFYVRGRVQEVRGRRGMALELYSAALTLQPRHLPATLRSAIIHTKALINTDQVPSAEASAPLTSTAKLALSLLEEALRLDPLCPEAWVYKARLLKYEGQLEEASECMQAALELNSRVPIVPLYSLPRKFC